MVDIMWLGQMGFILKTRTTTICIDYFATPMEERLVPPPIEADRLMEIDAFLGTHDHPDHIDHDAWKIWARTNPGARRSRLEIKVTGGNKTVIATAAVSKRIAEDMERHMRG